MTIKDKLSLLKSIGIIHDVIGPIPDLPRLGLLCWARRHTPKPLLGHLTRIAIWLATEENCTVIIEDEFPRVSLNRDKSEQIVIDRKYSDYFAKAGIHDIHFSSEIYRSTENVFGMFLESLSHVTFSAFLSLLPENKRVPAKDGSDDLSLLEICHAGLNLVILRQMETLVDCWLTGINSFAMAMTYRQISSRPLSIILTSAELPVSKIQRLERNVFPLQ